jgi:hypothetical protein
MGFHLTVRKGRTAAQNRAEKQQRVTQGRTHAALVLDGDQCLGWCRFGLQSLARSPAVLPQARPDGDIGVRPAVSTPRARGGARVQAVWSSTFASGAFFCTEAMPFRTAAWLWYASPVAIT